jgi:hypothetical protein
VLDLFAASLFAQLWYRARNNGEGTPLSELANLYLVLCWWPLALARLFLSTHLIWFAGKCQPVKACCGVAPLPVHRHRYSCFCVYTLQWNPWIFSIFLTRARYFLRVGSLVMHSFSICPVTTLEFVQRIHLWTPMTLNFWSPVRIASYSAMLLVHLSASLLNCNHAA